SGDGDGDEPIPGEPGCGNGPAPGDWCPTAASPRSTGAMPWGIAAADFDGNGNNDLAVALQGESAIIVHYGDGTGDITGGTKYSVGMGPAGVALADFEGNGKLDLVSSDYGAGTITALINTGN